MNSTLWVALALVGSLAAIIYFLKLVSRKQALARRNAIRARFNALLSQHNLSPEITEEFPHRILGLDSSQQRFIFTQEDPAQPHELIDLAEQRECRVVNSGVSVSTTDRGGKQKTEQHINLIGLAFTSRSGVRITVPLYTEALDGVDQRQHLQEKAGLWHRRMLQAMSALREAA